MAHIAQVSPSSPRSFQEDAAPYNFTHSGWFGSESDRFQQALLKALIRFTVLDKEDSKLQ
jgi:hypothetical protein